MPRIFGKTYSRRQLMRYVGNIDQVCGVRKVVLDDGSARGVNALEFRTGTGFEFTVLADRGMDISAASYCGRSLCWRSPTGDVSPAFYNPAGLEWLRTFFGGLLATCGLTYAGAPTTDRGEQLGLHGRYTSLPASQLHFGGRWEGNRYLIGASGTMRETAVFGPNIVLRRTITAEMGQSRLVIEDEIENEGWTRQPLMLLYHCNFGWPLVDANTRLFAPARQTLARADLKPVGEKAWSRFDPPRRGVHEQVFYHELAADRRGDVTVVLANEAFGDGKSFAVYLRYRKRELPRFVQWKMPGEGTYALGLEPSNCWVDGRDAERRRRTLQYLRPGETLKTRLEIGVLDDRRAIAEMKPPRLELSRLAPARRGASTLSGVKTMELKTTALVLTTLYDNYLAKAGLETRHGFSCLVEADQRKILFDTGGDGDVLLRNMKRLKVDPRQIQIVVLSHIHGDHTGGLDAVLAVNPYVEVVLPASFPSRFKAQVQSRGARLREVSRPERLSPAVATTGELGRHIIEQSLMVNTVKGLVVVTGCAHPGILLIAQHAKKLTRCKLHLVLGGFHLSSASEAELRRIIAELRRLGVERIAPSHCSGKNMRRLAQQLYGENFINNGVGAVIRIPAAKRPDEKLNPADAGKIFDHVARAKGLSRAEAERLCHLYVCRGTCSWFTKQRDPRRFDPDTLSPAERQEIERLIAETGFDLPTAVRLIHLYICHS